MDVPSPHEGEVRQVEAGFRDGGGHEVLVPEAGQVAHPLAGAVPLLAQLGGDQEIVLLEGDDRLGPSVPHGEHPECGAHGLQVVGPVHHQDVARRLGYGRQSHLRGDVGDLVGGVVEVFGIAGVLLAPAVDDDNVWQGGVVRVHGVRTPRRVRTFRRRPGSEWC